MRIFDRTTQDGERQLAADIVHAAHRLATAIERDTELTDDEWHAQREVLRQHHAAAQDGER